MPVPVLPPFPDDVKTHPLLVIDYQLLQERDEPEINRLWTAATELGFWYLKNHDLNEPVDEMFATGEETLLLPLDVKLQYEQGDSGASFGYKALGATVVDAQGNLDSIEFLNISKDDALAFPQEAHRNYPETINQRMTSTITPFVTQSIKITNTILDIFNEKLELPVNTLTEKMHPPNEYSSSEIRWTRSPGGNKVERVAMGAHTDFGSLSLLFNRLGGLQVMPVGKEEWEYVKPLPGHAVCNIGDALAFFSGGILRSSLHRVVGAPGRQAGMERWSMVYFTRPGDSIQMRALSDQSPLIAKATAASDRSFDAGTTAYEWFTRRIRNYRVKNRKGPETWLASRGTEHSV